MKYNQKLVITCFFVLAVSFSFLFVYLMIFEMYAVQYHNVNGSFEGIDFNKKKILILGASSVDVLNFTHIDKYLAKNMRESYEVFNLTEDGDRPTKRINQIDEIIQIKPDLVLYGLGMREFGYDTFSPGLTNCIPLDHDMLWDSRITPSKKYELELVQENFEIFEPLVFLRNEVDKKIGSQFSTFVEPKFATISLLNKILYEKEIKTDSFLTKNYTELKKQGGVNSITPNERLEKKIEGRILGFCKIINDEELGKLEQIIKKLQEHNIDVRVFVAPYSGPFLDTLSLLTIQHYITGLYAITNNSNVELYSFLDTYKDFDIFYDETHMSATQDALIFSEDFAGLVLDIIKQKEKKPATTQYLSEFNYQPRKIYLDIDSEQIDHFDSFEQIDLSGLDLTGKNFSQRTFLGTNFIQTNIQNADFSFSNLTNTDFSGANMPNVNMSNTNIIDTLLYGTNLIFADFTNANFFGVDIRSSKFMGIKLINQNLTNVDFSGSNLLSTDFHNTTLTNVDFSGSQLAKTNFKGVKIDNRTKFAGAAFIDSDLSGFDMSFLNLSGTDFENVNLTNTSFQGSKFVFANLFETDLSTVNLQDVVLLATDLRFANLSNANLTKINAKHTQLSYANLTGADLSFADFKAVDFSNADLSNANLTGTIVNFANFTGAILDNADLRCLDHSICNNKKE